MPPTSEDVAAQLSESIPEPPATSTISSTVNSLPTSVADIQFHDPEARPSLSSTLRSLRSSTLSLPNRLTSILADSKFVQSVADKYDLPLVANERCGSWYIPPQQKTGSAYFKSTDGHYGQWGFSLRRLNLSVMDLIEKSGKGGCIIVDSTRRGKGWPDALSKTVPIWCAVVNRICFAEEKKDGWWGGKIQWPEGVVSVEEAESMDRRIEGFVKDFHKLGVDIKGRLTRPLKCFWVRQGKSGALPHDLPRGDNLGKQQEYHAIVLCSASRRVDGTEMSQGGYIQGAGDDAEAWALGLTPEVFWEHGTKLLSTTNDEDLEELVEELVKKHRQNKSNDGHHILIQHTAQATGKLYLGTRPALQDPINGFDLVINCHGFYHLGGVGFSGRRLDLNLHNIAAKMGSRDLRKKLPQVRDFVKYNYERDPGQRLLITCETGKNLSVGVALVVLCLFYDDEGQLVPEGTGAEIDKTFIRQRLAWITETKPEANPSRSTLQAVNSFLFERP